MESREVHEKDKFLGITAMVGRTAEVGRFLKDSGEKVILDVRTPAEYERGHIPGALNLPLFSNEERVQVGTLYKQVSPEQAFLKGLELAGAKMRWYVEEARRLAPSGKVFVHCWRGGKRSESMGWLFQQAGFDVVTLKGGYKAYRNFLLDWFEKNKLPLFILGGYTGSGKTEVLHALQQQGEQIIDLEAIACHKGSAFGALGCSPQPSVEQFENDLFKALLQLDISRRIWLENESKAIGRVYIPSGLWHQVCEAPLFNMVVPKTGRIDRLVREYGLFSKEELIASFEKIRKRIGGQNLRMAEDAIDQGNLPGAVDIALVYYDKTYRHGLEKRDPLRVFSLDVASGSPASIARQIIQLVDNLSANGKL